MRWFKSFVRFISSPGTRPQAISVKMLREARTRAFEAHREAILSGDTRTQHYTRQDLTHATTALLRAERLAASSASQLPSMAKGSAR